MDTIFLNFKNSKTFDPHTLLIYLLDTIDMINTLFFQILTYTIHGK